MRKAGLRIGAGSLVFIWMIAAVPAASASPAPATQEADGGQQTDFYKRIMEILKGPPDLEYPKSQTPAEGRETPIFGPPEVSREQMVSFIRRHNPFPKINCSLEELVDMYYEEASHEGVRPDLALAQAIMETGYFRFGSDVLPQQNNFSGLGTTGGGVQGAFFETPRTGVRAHIQHLIAYSATRDPLKPLVDPRFHLVRALPYRSAQCSTWESLSGKWAVPGVGYGERIVKIIDAVKTGR
ncbi:MAG TPA: glucosaminidase domain-containing protein [Selenomonadales bacterium]|nr:glucosaminidase domain-containing protein [Selenomonadales bacterium]